MKRVAYGIMILALLLGVAALIVWIGPSQETPPTAETTAPTADSGIPAYGSDEKNVVVSIDNQHVRLVNGEAREPAAPGSAAMVITKYFGNEVWTDLNGDGRKDVVYLVTQNAGGSGTFYYAVAVLDNAPDGFTAQGSAYFIGDRIAPQTTSVDKNGVININYADRKPGESFATPPSVGKTLRLKFDPESGQFGVVANGFEGDADPARMTLATNERWTWIKTEYADGRTVAPKKAGAFTLHFRWDGVMSGTTDCNSLSGNAIQGGNGVLTFERVAMTQMYCEGAQESDYVKMLGDVSRYHFTSRGELVLEFRFGAGTMIFR